MKNLGTGTKLIVICGLPGSGKTTHARQLENKLHAIRFSADDWMDCLSLNLHEEDKRERIEALQWQLARKLLALGVAVIIEWGAWARSERDALRLEARALGAAVELHYLTATMDILLERIRRRGRESPPIERDAMLRWAEQFQEPTPDEMALFDKAFTLNGDS